MVGPSVRSGFRAASGNVRLVLAVWAWNGLLALIAGVAVGRWLETAFAHAPEADKLLERFRVGPVVELMQYDRFSPLVSVNGVMLGLILLAAVCNPLLSAGVLEVIVSSDDRPVLHRFLRGAGHFFGRFLRLLLISAVAAGVLFVLAAAVTRPIVSSLSESSWERTWIAAGLGRLVLLAGVVGVVAMILDVARARVVTSEVEVRGMLRAWWQAARHVFRHFGGALGVGLSYVAAFGLMLAVYAIVSSLIPARTWAGILSALLVQQLFMIGRAGLRVARAGAFVQFSGGAPSPGSPARVRREATPSGSPARA
jgi:hypothetical protein